MKQAKACKIESVHLDLGVLTGVDEADVLMVDHRFDFHRAIGRNDRQQSLRRCYDSTDSMDRQLLHSSIYGSHQGLIFGSLFGLGHILCETVGLATGLGQIA